MSRSRLKLSKADAVYLLVGAATFAIALYTQANLMFWLCGLLAGGLVAALVMPGITLHHLDVERLLPGQATAGQDVVLQYRLRNRKRWWPAIDLTVAEIPPQGGPPRSDPRRDASSLLKGAPHAWALHVGPCQEVTISGVACALRRGELRLDEMYVETGFPFGLFRQRRRLRQPQRMVVFPQRFALRPGLVQQLVRHETGGRVPMRRSGGVDEFYGLREYRPGDALKTIDWKHSAKGRGWVSRELTMLSPPRVVVGLDLRSAIPVESSPAPWEQRMEKAISLAASILDEAYARRYRFGLQVAGVPGVATSLGLGEGKQHRDRLLGRLALLPTQAIGGKPGNLAGASVIVIPGGSGRGGNGRTVVLEAMHPSLCAVTRAAPQGGGP